MNQKVITRFAPSPTGTLHVGSARTALFSYLYAKAHKGTFILRIEDTDKERSEQRFEDDILEGLAWLGIEFDEKHRQSERVDIHKKYLEKLIDTDKAYISKETPKVPGGRTEVIRFRNPGKKVTFTDEIRGDVTFDTTELGDFVIAKDMETPLFHLVVVTDDHDMGVTHVIRGEDHISNTPRQILIQEALGFPTPVYAHLPLILGADRSKLSKRHGALSVNEYGKSGYLPQAMVNFIALIGWNPGGDKEIFSQEELVEAFSLSRIQKAGAIFNTEKLDWVNRQYIQAMSKEESLAGIVAELSESTTNLPDYSEERLARAQDIILEKIKKFNDISEFEKEGELEFYFKAPMIEGESLDKICWKKEPDKEVTAVRLEKVLTIVTELSTSTWSNDIIKEAVAGYAEEEGRGEVLWPTRFALSGKERSPDPFSLIFILGQEEATKRLLTAITALRSHA